jgi:Tfp pilus assembly protein PilF
MGDSVLLGRALNQRGRALVLLGRAGGEHDIDDAIRIAESVGDTTCLMPAWNFKGFVYYGAGRYDDAIRCFERRLLLAQRTHSPVDEAWARTSLGLGYHTLGDHARARHEYEQALELFHAAGQRRLEVNALIGLGRVESALGNGPAAIRWYQQAWIAAREFGDRLNEMWAVNNLSAMESEQGDLSRSWEYLQRAIVLARQLNSPFAMVIPSLNLFSRLTELGDFQTAEAVLDQTRTLCETKGTTQQLATLDYHFATLRMAQGRNAAATAIMRRLATNPGALEAQHRDALVVDLAVALASNDSAAAAIDLLSRHVKTRGARLYGDTAPSAHLVLGRLYADGGNTGEALACARRARAGRHTNGAKTRHGGGDVFSRARAFATPETSTGNSDFYAALDSLAEVRGGISTPQWREVYGQWVARDVIESGRVLLEYPESSSRAERERAFFDAIQRVKSRALLDRISRPRAATADVGPHLSNHVATLAELQTHLQPGETVLDFCVGAHRSFLAAVTPDSLRLVELPGPGSALTERVQLLRTVLASTDPALRWSTASIGWSKCSERSGATFWAVWRTLSAAPPACSFAPTDITLPSPFGILIIDKSGDILMKARDVLQVPSASVLVLERAAHRDESPPGHRVVAISASAEGLSGARAEVNALARHYRDVEVRSDLNGVSQFAEAAQRADALHIASHALLVDRSPWWSGIELRRSTTASTDTAAVSGGGAAASTRAGFLSDVDSLTIEHTFPSDPYVRAWQIANLDIPSRLAVLSACETAGGRMTTGEGTLGLTAAFLSAGVPVVRLQPVAVDDRLDGRHHAFVLPNLAAGKPVATRFGLPS